MELATSLVPSGLSCTGLVRLHVRSSPIRTPYFLSSQWYSAEAEPMIVVSGPRSTPSVAKRSIATERAVSARGRKPGL